LIHFKELFWCFIWRWKWKKRRKAINGGV